MEQNFYNYLLKFSKENPMKSIILTTLKYIGTIFLFSLVYSILYKENGDGYSKWMLLILIKTLIAIIVGIIYGFLNFNLYSNIQNKTYTLNKLRSKYIFIKGVLGWGILLYISSLPIHFTFSSLITKALIYSICGLLFGYSMFNSSKNVLIKYVGK